MLDDDSDGIISCDFVGSRVPVYTPPDAKVLFQPWLPGRAQACVRNANGAPCTPNRCHSPEGLGQTQPSQHGQSSPPGSGSILCICPRVIGSQKHKDCQEERLMRVSFAVSKETSNLIAMNEVPETNAFLNTPPVSSERSFSSAQANLKDSVWAFT